MRRLAEAQQARATGKGRRPSVTELGRLLKRTGLDFGAFDRALRRLEELAEPRRIKPTSGAELLAQVASARGGGGA